MIPKVASFASIYMSPIYKKGSSTKEMSHGSIFLSKTALQQVYNLKKTFLVHFLYPLSLFIWNKENHTKQVIKVLQYCEQILGNFILKLKDACFHLK